MKNGERRRKTAKIATQRHFSSFPTLRSIQEQISVIFDFEHKVEARLDIAQVGNKDWERKWR